MSGVITFLGGGGGQQQIFSEKPCFLLGIEKSQLVLFGNRAVWGMGVRGVVVAGVYIFLVCQCGGDREVY